MQSTSYSFHKLSVYTVIKLIVSAYIANVYIIEIEHFVYDIWTYLSWIEVIAFSPIFSIKHIFCQNNSVQCKSPPYNPTSTPSQLSYHAISK